MKLCKAEYCNDGYVIGHMDGEEYCPKCTEIRLDMFERTVKEAKKIYKGPQTDRTPYINIIERQILKRILGAELLNRILLANQKEKKECRK